MRFHTDNSFLFRYYNRPAVEGPVSRVASSLTFDLGFEQGDGVSALPRQAHPDPTQCTKASPCEQDFVRAACSTTISGSTRTASAGWPAAASCATPAATSCWRRRGWPRPAAERLHTNPGTTFVGWDTSHELSWYRDENITFRLENSFHHARAIPTTPAAAASPAPTATSAAGSTNADGNITTCVPPGWTPDLVKNEDKLILAAALPPVTRRVTMTNRLIRSVIRRCRGRPLAGCGTRRRRALQSAARSPTTATPASACVYPTRAAAVALYCCPLDANGNIRDAHRPARRPEPRSVCMLDARRERLSAEHCTPQRRRARDAASCNSPRAVN